MVFAPQLTKAWTIVPNKRNAYTSLANMTGWCLFENKKAMKDIGWTVWFTCDGTTGPTDANDHTDRWVTNADADNRGAAAGNAQSFAVMKNADGVQVLLAFQGATDDVARISFSPKVGFTLAGTTNQQPTASDEVVITAAANSLVNSGTTLDRVMTIWTSDDTKAWCFAIWRNSTLLNVIGVERINTFCPTGVFGDGTTDYPFIGYRYNATGGMLSRDHNAVGGPYVWVNVAVGASTCSGIAARVFTAAASRLNRITIRCAAPSSVPGTGFNGGGTAGWVSQVNTPALQGGSTYPLHLVDFVGEKTANLDGWLGTGIDWWQDIFTTSLTIVPAVGDFSPGFDPGDVPGVSGGQSGGGEPRTNWMVSLGASWIRAWRNAAVSLEIT